MVILRGGVLGTGCFRRKWGAIFSFAAASMVFSAMRRTFACLRIFPAVRGGLSQCVRFVFSPADCTALLSGTLISGTLISGTLLSAALLSGALLLSGCTVGPSFKRPPAPQVGRYTATALPGRTAGTPVAEGTSQVFKPGEDIPGRWWRLFHCQALDLLESAALARNYTLEAAQAALREAYENERAQAGALLYPQIGAKATGVRQKFSGAAFGQPGRSGIIFNLFNASASVSYLFDIFGGSRRELEALGAQVDYQRFQMEGAYIALTANVVTTAVQEASLRAQIKVTKSILADQQAQLRIVRRQYMLGGASLPDVLAQKTLVAQTLAEIPPLEKALSQARHLMAVLAGVPPERSGQLPETDIDRLILPRRLPLSLPSVLVLRRPDIRASGALLHAASAQIGVATANMLPQVTFNGSIGSETTKVEDLFGSNTSIWDFGISLLQPVFQGGELTAKRRAAVDAYEQALAQYQETVLTAFQNVADVLRALDRDAETLKAQALFLAAARDSLDVSLKQFRLGAVSYLQLLNAQRQYQQAEISLVQARAARLSDTAALFLALGGGWWNLKPGEPGRTTGGKD